MRDRIGLDIMDCSRIQSISRIDGVECDILAIACEDLFLQDISAALAASLWSINAFLTCKNEELIKSAAAIHGLDMMC